MPGQKTHKHFRLDSSKIKRAQKVLRVQTETQAIELALDMVLTEHRRNQLAADANQRFLESGAEIADVYSVLGK